jgi:hypothetical protein
MLIKMPRVSPATDLDASLIENNGEPHPSRIV